MIEKLNPHYSMTNPASIYDEEALTALELAGRTAAKMNQTVEAFNTLEENTGDHLNNQDKTIENRMKEQDDRITKMNDVTMPEKVTQEVKEQIDNGTFDQQIDEYIGNLENRVNNLLGAVTEGSTTMDAEVIDLRTDVDGAVHKNAGESVRSQVTNIPPTRLRLSGSDSSKLYPTFEDGCYYVNVGIGHAPNKNTNDIISAVRFDNLRAGEKIKIWVVDMDVTATPENYFVFMNVDGLSIVTTEKSLDFVEMEVTESGNYYYHVTIPNGCTSMYSSCVTAQKDAVTDRSVRTQEEYTIDWLRLKKENFPEGCVPSSALSFDNYDVWEHAPFTTEDGYYKAVSGTTITDTEFDILCCIKIPDVQVGDTYQIFVPGSDINDRNIMNFAVFEGVESGVSVIPFGTAGNYVTCENNLLTVTIPENCVTLYSACFVSLKNSVFVKRHATKAVFDGLRLVEENFQEKTIPLSALKASLSVDTWKHDVLEKPFSFNGKRLIAFGDSITHGVTSPNLSVTENSYIKLFAEHTGMTLTNRAVSGSTLSYLEGWGSGSITDKVLAETGSYDVIIIAGGTNDYNQNRNIGTFGDTTNDTVYGAMKVICDHLKANFPNAVIIFITPVNCTKSFNNEHLLDEYRKPIFEVATAYGYNVVDGSSIGLPDAPSVYANSLIGQADGCHPTEEGHELYYRGLCTKLL